MRCARTRLTQIINYHNTLRGKLRIVVIQFRLDYLLDSSASSTTCVKVITIVFTHSKGAGHILLSSLDLLH